MSENKLVANARDNFGKGAARKLRAAGQTPAVVYGHGTDPLHISVDAHALSLIVRQANALIELDVDGKPQLVLVKDVQKDPVRQIIEHIDLIVVKKGEKVEVEVPVHVTGVSFSGTNALQELNTLRLSVPATNIRDFVEVSVEGLEAGTRIVAGDVQLDADELLLDAADQLVVHIVTPRGASEDEGAEAEAAE
ncbi:50S ribosomal protein L25/general stress protein Ctc [Leucobacter sp. gxy201]|uniref:50S ribosomal protein L25/general stress protein Ctc n=1 Tax=Leucobacter sp. gxy201 TaxID=2957200 RepID=UPI003DA106BC